LARMIKEFWLGLNLPPLVCSESFVMAQKLHTAQGLGLTHL
jgi:hypothetical protein